MAWRAEAIGRIRSGAIASLAFCLLRPHAKGMFKPEDLDPYAIADREEQLEKMRQRAEHTQTPLPDNPTNEQIDTAWQRFKKSQEQAQGQ